MLLNKLHTTLLLSLCATLAACSADDALVDGTSDGKTPIELSVGGADAPGTRAVITDGVGKTLRAFTADTRLFLAYVAEHDEDGSKPKLYGFNYATAEGKDNPDVNSESDVTYSDNYLYWDDAYARDTKVSVYSLAVANKEKDYIKLTSGETVAIGTESPGQAIIPFTSTNPGVPTLKWQIANPQSKEVFESADLVFSNNIADNTSGDKRLTFHKDPADGDKYHKFDKGELIYYHALTQFTIKIKCGDGFNGDGTDFNFTNNAGIVCESPDNSFALNGFYGANGVFDVTQGEFNTMTDSNLRDYTSIYKRSETHQKKNVGDYYVMKAYVFPGTDMTGTKDDAFSFIIDGNKYDISLGMLYDAIKTGSTNVTKLGPSPSKVDPSILEEITLGEGGKKLKAGVNYEFTFTVDKSKISAITAQVVDWESVTADNVDASNARISLVLEERGDYVTSGVDFYRAKDPENTIVSDTYKGYKWLTGYNTDGKATGISCTDNKWAVPNWYWPDNTTFYHFRALAPTTSIITTATADYTTLSAGTSYTDVRWGAPILDDGDNETPGTYKLYYNTTSGFDATGDGSPNASHQIYHGVGPTNADIKLTMFHMMSDITINVTSVTGDAAVKLTDGLNKTKIKFENIYTSGSVAMGNGLVSTTGDASTTDDLTMSSTDNKWIYGAIPQSLEGATTATTDDVILVITTPDNNEYRVSMKDVVASATPTYNNVSYPAYTANKVNNWYPGVKYTYTFKLSKKKIESIIVTILDWETVEAGDDNVQIK